MESFAGPGLFDRDTELRLIAELIAQAQAGQGGFALLEGPAGIGKTSLVQAGIERAREAGVDALAARGAELEEAFAFGVARQLFEPVAARDGVLEGHARLAAPLLGVEPPAGTSSTALVHGLFWVASNLAASEPLLIAVDDAQWADAPSRRFLAYLAKRLEGLPIALLVASRERVSFEDRPGETVELRPLSPEGVTLTVRAALGDAADAAFCSAAHRATAGNPYYLHQLLRRAEAEDLAATADNAQRLADLESPEIARFVRARLDALGPDAAALARAMAVLETDVELRHAASLGEVEEGDAVQAADALAAADILAPGRPLRFVHPLVQASIHGEMPFGERAQMHAAAARLLAGDGAEPARVAAHLLMAEPAAEVEVVEHLRAAARDAVARGSAEIAASYLERALAEPPPADQRADVLLELGRAEASTGNAAGFERIADALAMATDPVARAEIALDLGRGLMLVDRGPEAVEVLDASRDELADGPAELTRRLAAEATGAALMDVTTAPAALVRLRESDFDEAGDSTGDRLLLAYGAFALAAAGAPPADVVVRAQRALAAGDLADEETVIPFCFAATSLACCDRFDEALAALGAALDVARQRGSALMFAVCSWLSSHVEFRRGSVRAAEASARDCLEPDVEAWFSAGVAFLADALIERGELDEAAEAFRAFGLEGELFPDLLIANTLLYSRGRLRCLRGEPEAGLADLLECGRRLVGAGATNPAIVAWRSAAALAHMQLDDVEAARTLAAEEVALAGAFGAPRAHGMALRAAGLVEARAGEQAEALALLTRAAEVLDGSGAELEQARALVDVGAALRRAGKRGDAREPLRHGLDRASRCGADTLTARAREELVAAGAKPRRERTSGADALTASERRVAEMAAEGMTNRQIAEALFVTRYTIVKHLTHVYEKLDIKDRTELPSALRRATADP